MKAQGKTPAHRETALIADGGGLPLALHGHRVEAAGLLFWGRHVAVFLLSGVARMLVGRWCISSSGRGMPAPVWCVWQM